MLKKNDIIKILTELKPILYKDYSVKEIGLFGSYSDDSFHSESDVDLLIELEKPIGWKVFSLELFLEKALGKKVDLVTKSALKPQIKQEILEQVNYI